MPSDPFRRMTPLELAAGWVPGFEPETPADTHGPPLEPMAALEQIMLGALQRPPCLIEFSGGRDSSALLAVAVQVARREGLQLPIPLTRFFTDAPGADEGEWPELVINHLELADWIKLRIHDELDLLGPVAAEGLRRNGVLWPVTTHTKVVTFEQARGSTLISGEGGDEVFGPRRITPLAKMLAGARPRHRGVKPVLAALSPPSIRGLALEKALRRKANRTWLLPPAQDQFVGSLLADALREPLAWSRSVRTLPLRRAWTMGRHNMVAHAKSQDVRYLHPLLDDDFVRALTTRHRLIGYPTRTHCMQDLFGQLLPEAVLARPTKATFIAVHVRTATRAFIDGWRGTGVDRSIIDPDALLRIWKMAAPHSASLALMQQAWLSEI